MKRLIVIIVTLAGFIAASLTIMNYISEKKILKDPKEFIKNPTKYIEKVEDENKQAQARRIAEEQERIREEKKKKEEAARRAREEQNRKTSARKAKENRKLFKTPRKSEAETLIIALLVIITIGGVAFLIYKYANKKNYDEDDYPTAPHEENDDAGDPDKMF